MTSLMRAFPAQFRQPSVSGLSQITKSLYISSGAAANNKLLLSSNQITTVINVSMEVVNTFYENIHGDERGPHTAALCCWSEPLCCLVSCLPHEVPCHVPAGCPHVDQVLPAHHPTQQWLLGAAHPL
ncbi:dual specificity protein phosphatase 18-like isoform X2 [Octodon degus]|uniref:Dual specificity protein phosphatase 18-like isoform X2 n=1 Tax=Octodon degus TaxID=10160 RepID=A0A6P3VD10_OCTDE|nr:dual specificity protein phosphatase 18-like isoform X2 [Octodon degus]